MIKDLITWNRACCLKLIWLLFFQSGSVWVAWFRSEVLGGNMSNFWTATVNPKNSLLANKLIKMRGEVFTWITMRVGNRRICRFWTDNWSPYGSMETFLLSTSETRLGIPRIASLVDLNDDGNWLLPPARSDEWLQLQIYLTTVSLNQDQDYYEWILEDKPTKKYSTSDVYNKLRGDDQSVPWAKVIWNKGGIPRHSFLAWLFTLNRCPTCDRLLSWGLQSDSTCLLCDAADESRDHLLFECSFSWNMWSAVSSK